jgi:hypothetical protein
MTFNVLSLAHTPDADPDKHKCQIETSVYKFYAVLVKDQKQAIEVGKKYVREKEIHSLLLCPGFTNKDIGELAQILGPNVGISVARGDSQSNAVAREAMKKAGWF